MDIRLRGRRAECEFLDTALHDVHAGWSRVVVLRGDAGAGKTSLLNYVTERAVGWRIVTAVGVESEMELAYSGLHLLCAPLLPRLDRLPRPQRTALATVFGRETGPTPDRFLVGLGILTLLADVADEQPLLCVIDDAQWLDGASAQIIAFVARRLLAEPIALMCAARTGLGHESLDTLPTLPVTGLGDSDARALLLENLPVPLDAAVCEQLLSESHGNPLAILELPRSWHLGELAGGYGFPARHHVTGRIEQSYAKRLAQLPAESQLLVLAAAAEPLGDPALLQRAIRGLGINLTASAPVVDAGLLEVSGHIKFAHPLVRSAAYATNSEDDRRRVHRALAEATDPGTDADRRAWHRARGSGGPDEDVATDLENSAGRAQARGGVAAAAAFLERAAALTPDPGTRARRSLAAAEAQQLAGAYQASSRLLAAAADGPLGSLETARVQRLQGQIALGLRRGADAVPFLLDAAKQLEAFEPALARETYLEALRAASIAGRFGADLLRRAAQAARQAPPSIGAPRAIDLLLDGLAIRFTDGLAASVPALQLALTAVRAEGSRPDHDVRWPWYSRRVAIEVFDYETARVLATLGVQQARDTGALGLLPLSLGSLATIHILDGHLDVATRVLDESDVITDAIGETRIGSTRLLLAALRGDEATFSRLAEEADAEATARSEGLVLTFSEHARALLYNGLGRYESAARAAESASARNDLDASVRSMPELIEAATRCGEIDLAVDALERLAERSQAAGTDWALGIEARSRALTVTDVTAEGHYLEAITRLGRCRIAPELARGHLLYGEWLRREGRRVEARDQLRSAHEMLSRIGMDAFAERARRELAATGEKVRRRRPETFDVLTAQERHIAELARAGHSNPEIATRLFVSSRTVEWHLRKVFAKLGISSRKELVLVLPDAELA